MGIKSFTVGGVKDQYEYSALIGRIADIQFDSATYSLMFKDEENNILFSVDMSNVNAEAKEMANTTQQSIGELDSLTTSSKESVVSAINELNRGILEAPSSELMINTGAIYRYVGSEDGYEQNALYYYNGTDWVQIGREVDDTLTRIGVPADAKTVGDEISGLKEFVNYSEEQIVEVPLVDYKYNAWDMQSGTNQGIAPTLTPQKITITNPSSSDIKLVGRFLDGEDPETANIWQGTSATCVRGFASTWSCPANSTVTIETKEYGRSVAKYIQLRWTNYPKPNPQIVFHYDPILPSEPSFSDENDAYKLDLPMRWMIRGVWKNDAFKRLICIVPFYPNTDYYVRNAYSGSPYTDERFANSIFVCGLVDDSIFDVSIEEGGNFLYSNHTGITETKIDAYYHIDLEREQIIGTDFTRIKTRSWEDTIGCKYLAIATKVQTTQLGSASDALDEETLDDELDSIMQSTSNTYASRFNQYVARAMNSQLAVINEKITDNALQYTNNPLWGAKWTLFGDSLTADYGGKDLSSNYFAAKIAKEFNLDLDNRALGGGNINTGTNTGTSGVSYTDKNGCDALDALIDEVNEGTTTAPDYITVAYGSNGFASQVGEPTDTSAQKVNTCGAVKYFIEQIRENFPNAVLGFVLPPPSTWEGTDTRKDIDATRSAIKSVLELEDYKVPYIDMSEQSGITLEMMQEGDGIHIKTAQTQNLYYHAMRHFVMGL